MLTVYGLKINVLKSYHVNFKITELFLKKPLKKCAV